MACSSCWPKLGSSAQFKVEIQPRAADRGSLSATPEELLILLTQLLQAASSLNLFLVLKRKSRIKRTEFLTCFKVHWGKCLCPLAYVTINAQWVFITFCHSNLVKAPHPLNTCHFRPAMSLITSA